MTKTDFLFEDNSIRKMMFRYVFVLLNVLMFENGFLNTNFRGASNPAKFYRTFCVGTSSSRVRPRSPKSSRLYRKSRKPNRFPVLLLSEPEKPETTENPETTGIPVSRNRQKTRESSSTCPEPRWERWSSDFRQRPAGEF